ncbi:MAG: DUF1501 domain-containing protein [Bdellovibrionaceae bacterium]|nr:DUF1501 domain-containing protein [Pseudobdellovibrionaceae bacterium]
MNKNHKLNRRQFLGLASAFSGASILNNPYSIVLDHMINGLVNKALAETTGVNPRRYIAIQQFGAPARWNFDLFLTPYGNAEFKSNPMVGTKYIATKGRYTDMIYSTINYNGLNIPHMWQFPVPKAGGGTRAMTDLIDNLLAIQGINTGNAGHQGSHSLHMRPSGAVRSLNALTADYSSNPISAINLSTAYYNFKTLNSKSFVDVPAGGNMIQTLLNPFLSAAPDKFLYNLNNVHETVERGVSTLDQLAKQQHPLAKSINDDRDGAEKLLRKGAAGIGTVWDTLLLKYKDLIQRAIDPSQRLEGINDLPIGISGTRNSQYALNDATNIVTTADLRDLITGNTVISLMAENFAVSEYVILNDLSRSISMNTSSLFKLNTNGNTQERFSLDQHNSGKMICLYLNTMYFRAFSACLLELIDQLKAADLFSETVIDVSSEFNRSPKNSGTGSDHGWQGASTTIYSGAFGSPLILGNLKSNPGGSYEGTWGFGGEVKELSNKQLGLNHMAATVATLLRTPSPLTSSI